MFGSKKSENGVKKSNNLNTSSSHGLNSLVQGTSVSGTVTSDSDIRVDGSLKGELDCAAKIIIGPTGLIEGDVKCENALIEGTFKGTLIVRGTLHIKETASIDGDIRTEKLVVDQGAVFNVTCKMGSGSVSSSKQNGQKIAKGATA